MICIEMAALFLLLQGPQNSLQRIHHTVRPVRRFLGRALRVDAQSLRNGLRR